MNHSFNFAAGFGLVIYYSGFLNLLNFIGDLYFTFTLWNQGCDGCTNVGHTHISLCLEQFLQHGSWGLESSKAYVPRQSGTGDFAK
jgi:hypothetical protein